MKIKKGFELRHVCGEDIIVAYGIENMDYKYLAEDLVENEPELFTP